MELYLDCLRAGELFFQHGVPDRPIRRSNDRRFSDIQGLFLFKARNANLHSADMRISDEAVEYDDQVSAAEWDARIFIAYRFGRIGMGEVVAHPPVYFQPA